MNSLILTINIKLMRKTVQYAGAMNINIGRQVLCKIDDELKIVDKNSTHDDIEEKIVRLTEQYKQDLEKLIQEQ